LAKRKVTNQDPEDCAAKAETADKAEKPGFLKKCGTNLGLWTGLRGVYDRVSTIPSAWKGAISSRRELLRSNLEREEEFRQMRFEQVLHEWGVSNELQRKELLTSKKREFCVGIFLLVFGLTGICLQISGSEIVGYLGVFACLSVSLLGLTLILTSWWRMEVIRREHFLPFLDWMKQGCRF